MNTDTKRHIDAARQVLVGVVPNPTSQIDQITYALIYKFMDDMDQSAIKNGDEPAFFIGELEQYSWARLMDSKIGNQERMNIYVMAFQKFAEAKQLPELFRNILKSAFLPYRSPEVLGMFLKEINYFDYSHPEELGNAYEYLLSIMSSQGDAGQFRTPRHIIDFMVEVINPTKVDKVLDPACGTGGFLVSSFNHILKQHDGKDDPEKKEKPLTPDERKKMMNNFEGYDIDPTMVRIAQVNMYLHQFKNPKIQQYDTLSMDDNWNDKFDVILANPPFMSPKGGVSTHSKFSIQSTRSEVLFVDYIMNHLRPKGRAGIIVPEGIIFQSGKSHKQLRKNLVEDGLYAVVSLPSGVFAPYAGVKTSLLFFDNELAKQKKEILFVKIENDGFDLGAQRRTNNKNDLPRALEILKKWHLSSIIPVQAGIQVIAVEKSKIAEDGDYNLSGDRYRVATDYSNAKWSMVELGDEKYFTIESGGTPDSKNQEYWNGDINWATLVDLPAINLITRIYETERKITQAGLKSSSAKLLPINSILISSRATIGRIAINSVELATNQGFKNIIVVDHNNVNHKFVALVLTSLIDEMKALASGGTFAEISKSNLSKIKIPLPPLEVQEQIVAELDGYANIISGAKQIVQNWKPKLDIDPKWEKVKLGAVCEIGSSKRVFESEWEKEGVPFYRAREIVKLAKNGSVENELFISEKMFQKYSEKYGCPKEGDLMVTGVGTLGVCYLVKREDRFYFKDGNIIWFKNFVNSIGSKFIEYLFKDNFVVDQIRSFSAGGTVGTYTITSANNTIIPLPPVEIQKQIVEKIEAERALVESSKKLIEIYEQKTKEVIYKLWN